MGFGFWLFIGIIFFLWVIFEILIYDKNDEGFFLFNGSYEAIRKKELKDN